MTTKALSRKGFGLFAAAAMGVALMFGACIAPASAFAAGMGQELAAGVATLSNGMINQVTEDSDQYGSIVLYNSNAIDPDQMASQYYEEYDKARDAVWEKYDSGSITYEQAEAQEEQLYQAYKTKRDAYKASVSKVIYDGWNLNAYIAEKNRNRIDNGDAALTAADIEKLKATDEYIELSDGSWEYGWASTIKSHTAQTVSGASYDLASNTLSIKDLKTTDNLVVRDAGNDFKVKIAGTNELGLISVYDDDNAYKYDSKKGYYVSVDKKANWGASVTVTGTGSLFVNKNKKNEFGIRVSTYNTAGALVVDKNVSLRACSDGSGPAIYVSGTNASAWKNAITMKGIDGTPQVKYSTSNIAYPLYQRAEAYDAEEAQEGVLAIDPNDGDYGYEWLLCSDKKHIARVSMTHKDAKTGKYVVDQWKVWSATITNNSKGGYDYSTDGDSVRVADSNGQPAGYSLIKLSDHAATNSYEVADTDFSQIGKTVVLGKATYTAKFNKTTGAAEVSLKKAPNKKTVTIGKNITVNGQKIAVTGIAKKAFAKAKKCTTVKIKTLKLTKKSVKKCFKGAKKVKTVKVPKKVKKAYNEYFAKGNCGKAVTVK